MKQQSLIADYCELTKPRILGLVLVTTTLGYFLGGGGVSNVWHMMILLAGVTLVCAGSAALNHYLERDADALMERTQNRPIPQGRIAPQNAMLFGILLILTGVIVLTLSINLLTAFLALLTAFLYVLVYTPMKRISWLNTTVGAIPGALPPMGGWAAATGDLSAGAWALFAIMFVWQHPHFYSIAWMCRDDYRQAGFKMLPVVHPDGASTFAQINVFAAVLIPISFLPVWLGISGGIYWAGAFGMGTFMLLKGFRLSYTKSIPDARELLKASVIYIQLILILIVVDHVIL
ncbi:MAG: heme o synthase [Candidatus Omnitrophota bacterium]|nr:heme o synthase [Candidatus Omnitrophota bacterium]MDZ4242691.1 heme o synthase [Candidatus Omnitrophota bacterium]